MSALRGSLRQLDPAATLARIAPLTRELGIVRVTEVTRLDRYGIPVFVGVRPDAQPGSLCVTAGKGLRREDAEVGAVMEAVEMAWAEYGRSSVQWFLGSARVLGGADALVSFAPLWGQRLDLDAPLPCVIAQDVRTGESVPVPAALVFHPFDAQPRWFGSSTNGLASGNTVEEASVHALLELVERDAMSFQFAGGASHIVDQATLPDELRALFARLAGEGLELFVRWVPSEQGLAVCSVLVSDPFERTFAMRGDGCHLVREIALVRAFTEAMQSRLSYIHGGRDDLVAYWRPAAVGETIGRAEAARFSRADVTVPFSSVPTESVTSVAAAWKLALERLAPRRVLRVVFTPRDYPIQVVKMIVPGLECYTGPGTRVGPRIRAVRDARSSARRS